MGKNVTCYLVYDATKDHVLTFHYKLVYQHPFIPRNLLSKDLISRELVSLTRHEKISQAYKIFYFLHIFFFFL